MSDVPSKVLSVFTRTILFKPYHSPRGSSLWGRAVTLPFCRCGNWGSGNEKVICTEGHAYLNSRASAQPLVNPIPEYESLYWGCWIAFLSFSGCGNVFLKTAASFEEENVSGDLNGSDRKFSRIITCLGDSHKSCFLQNTMFSGPEAFYTVMWDSSQSLAEGLEFLSPVFQLD